MPELRLVFVSKRSGNWQIYTSDLEGGDLVQLTFDAAWESWWPRVAPDGSRGVFYRSPQGTDYAAYEQAALWSMNLDGSDETLLIDVGGGGAYDWAEQGVANWSPDSASLVMAARPTGGRWQVWITAADGTGGAAISTRYTTYSDPAFSPDGTRIVFVAHPEDWTGSLFDATGWEVHTMNVDGTDEQRLTFDDRRDADPQYSPDGLEIAYESTSWLIPWNPWDIRAVAVAGGTPRVLAPADTISTVPRWAPDGTWLSFYHRAELDSGRWNLRRVDRDGTNNVAITSDTDWPNIEVEVYAVP